MAETFKRQVGSFLVEAELKRIFGDPLWFGTIRNGLTVGRFTAKDDGGAPRESAYMAAINLVQIDPTDVIRLVYGELDEAAKEPEDVGARPVERDRYRMAFALLVRWLEEGREEKKDLRQHLLLYEPRESYAFQLGYLAAEYRWKFQHERDALRGKVVAKGAASGGAARSAHAERTALYREIEQRVGAGERLYNVCADIQFRDCLTLGPRSLERSFRRWLRARPGDGGRSA